MRLTKRTADTVQPRSTERTLWDVELRGFGLRVRPSGAKSWVVKSRIRGRQARATIGSYPPMPPAEARRLAAEWLAAARRGEDPAEEKRRARAEQTVAELWEDFMAEARATRGAHSCATLSSYGKAIVGSFGKRRLSDVSRRDVAAWRAALMRRPARGKGRPLTPATVNRHAATLSGLFARAVRLGLIAANPCAGLGALPEAPRVVAPDDIMVQRLGLGLRAAEPRYPREVAALRCLLLTGLRRGELLGLAWDDVRREPPALVLRKTKSGRPRVAFVAPAVVELLDSLPRVGDLVFEHFAQRGRPLDLRVAWSLVKREAGLPSMRVHDLRHVAASVALASGAGLATVARMLGHAPGSQVTATYAESTDASLRAAATETSARILRLVGND